MNRSCDVTLEKLNNKNKKKIPSRMVFVYSAPLQYSLSFAFCQIINTSRICASLIPTISDTAPVHTNLSMKKFHIQLIEEYGLSSFAHWVLQKDWRSCWRDCIWWSLDKRTWSQVVLSRSDSTCFDKSNLRCREVLPRPQRPQQRLFKRCNHNTKAIHTCQFSCDLLSLCVCLFVSSSMITDATWNCSTTLQYHVTLWFRKLILASGRMNKIPQTCSAFNQMCITWSIVGLNHGHTQVQAT